MTLDNRGILVHRGYALGLALGLILLGDAPDQPCLHVLQTLQSGAGGHDKTLLLLARRPLQGQFLIVKPFQEVPHRGHFRHFVT